MKMKEEFYYEYLGFGRVESRCRIKILPNDGEHLICFEDIGEGTSVTNASELLATEIVDLKDLDPTNCRFFEIYTQYSDSILDEITYRWSFTHGRWEAKNPDWKPASEEIINLFKY